MACNYLGLAYNPNPGPTNLICWTEVAFGEISISRETKWDITILPKNRRELRNWNGRERGPALRVSPIKILLLLMAKVNLPPHSPQKLNLIAQTICREILRRFGDEEFESELGKLEKKWSDGSGFDTGPRACYCQRKGFSWPQSIWSRRAVELKFWY